MVFDPSTIDAAKKYLFTTKTAEKPATALTNEPVQLVVPPTWPGFAALANNIHPDTTLFLASLDMPDGSTSFVDLSAEGHTISVGGNTQHDTYANLDSSSAILFDGDGDYLTIPSHASLQFGTGDYTLSGWIDTSDETTDSGNRRIIAFGPNQADELQLILDTDAVDRHLLVFTTSTIGESTSQVSDGSLHHFAVTRSGTTARLFIDGVQEDSWTDSVNWSCDTLIYIGCKNGTTTEGNYNGYLQGLQCVKGTALWTANFTPPAAIRPTTPKKIAVLDDSGNQKPVEIELWEKGPEPVSRWDFDNISGSTLEDVVGTDDGTIYNMTQTAGGPFGTNYLSGGNVTSTSRRVEFDPVGIPFKSLAFWVRRIGGNYDIFASYDTKYIYFDVTVDELRIWNGSATIYTGLYLQDATPEWACVVMVEGSTSNHHYFYVNGVKASAEVLTNFAGLIKNLGYWTTTSPNYSTPDTGGLQRFDFKLTDAQAGMLVAAGARGNQYVANHAVLHSVLPSTDDTGLKLYYDETQDDNTTYVGDTGDTIAQTVWPSGLVARYGMSQDPSGTAPQILDSTSNENHGTSAGSMTTADLVDADVGKGLDFDGIDDVIETGSNLGITGSNPRTYEFFGQPGGNYHCPLAHGGSSTGQSVRIYTESPASSGWRMAINGGNRIWPTNISLAPHHVAVVLASGDDNTSDLVGYVDGSAETPSSTSAATFSTTDSHLFIGDDKIIESTNPVDGVISEVRIWNTGRTSDQIALSYASLTDGLFDFALITSSTVDHLVYWDHPYGNLIGTNLVYWDHSYALLNYIIGYFDQVYGIQLLRYWDHTYGNNPLVKVFWDLLYGDQQQIKRFWDLDYGDRVELIRYWDQKYNIRTAIQQFWDQKYGIMGKEILKHWDQSYDVKNTNPLLKWFDQYYHIIADSVVESAALGFYIDGVRYEGPYHVSWELNVDSYKNTGEMHFNYPAPFFAAGEGKEMRIVDTDIDLKLEITIPTKSERTNETLYFIKGESKSRILERAEVFTETFRNTTAATICTTIAARYGITIDWQIPDWPLSEYDVNDQTPLQAIRGLTGDDCAKACLQTDFDGDTVSVMKRMESDSHMWDTDTPSYYITDSLHLEQTNQRGEYKKGYNAYRVTDQSSASETRTWIEDEEYADAKREVHVFRVPWDGTARSLYTSDNNATIQYLGIVTEDLEEEFSIVNGEGEGKTTKPAYAVVSWSYNDTNLGTPTVTEEGVVQTATEGNSMLTLTYTTRYYKWIVTDYDDPKIQIWVE